MLGQRAEGVMRFPQASAVGPDGSVYVADQYTHAIQVFGPDGSFRRELGAAGSGPGGLSSVGAVAVARDGSVYVADGADRIDRFAPDGTLLHSWGKTGDGPGEFRFGAGGGNDSGAGGGIAIGPDGTVYVADTRNDRVQRFAADGSNPTVIIPKGTVMRPNGLVVVGSRLIVADNWRHKLAVFDTGGRFLRNVGDGEGNRPNQFFHPYDVAADPSGRLYVADNSNHRIVRYGPAPSYKYRARWGAFGSGRGQLQYPRGLAVDGTGRTFVADPGGNRIDVFDIGGTSLGAFGKSGREAGPVHPPAGRRRGRERPARGRRHRQRADPARQPGRQRRRDVRRARTGADAAARPGRGRLRQLRAAVRRRPAALARDRLRPRRQDHPHDRQPRPRPGPAARAVRGGRRRRRARLRRRHRQRPDRALHHGRHAPRLLRALPHAPRRRGHARRRARLRLRRGDGEDHGHDRHRRRPGRDRRARLGAR